MEGKKTRTVANVRDNIVQSNLLIQGRKTLDLLGTRLFILALRTINPHFSEKDKYYDTEFRESFISTTKLVELLGGKNYLSMVDDTCQKILGSTVELGYGSGNSRPLRIFEKLDYEPRRGLRFLFSEDMRPHLLELNKSKGFTMIDSRYLLKLSSPYAVRLLELFLQFQNIIYFKEAMEIRRQLTIRQLRFMLNVPEDAYTNRIDNFKKNVLDIPLREINERTPYKIRYKTIKKGRRVNAIKFFVDTFAVRNDVEKRKRPRFSNDAIDRLHNLGFNEGAARAIFMKCKSVDDCFERIVRAETILTHQRARVTNRLGFLRKAILEDWQVHFAKEGLYYLDYSDKEQLAKLREERKNAPPVEPKKRVRRTPRQIIEDRYRRPTPEEMEAIRHDEIDEQERAVLEEIYRLAGDDPFAEIDVDVEAIRKRIAQQFAQQAGESAMQMRSQEVSKTQTVAEPVAEREAQEGKKRDEPPLVPVEVFVDRFVDQIVGNPNKHQAGESAMQMRSQEVSKTQTVAEPVAEREAEPVAQQVSQTIAEQAEKTGKKSKPVDEWEEVRRQEEAAKLYRQNYELKHQEMVLLARDQRSVGNASLLSDTLRDIVSSWNIPQEQKDKLLAIRKKIKPPFELQTPLYPKYIVLNGKICFAGTLYAAVDCLWGRNSQISGKPKWAREMLMRDYYLPVDRLREIFEEYWGPFPHEIDVDNDGYYQFKDAVLFQDYNLYPEYEHDPAEPNGPRIILVKGNRMTRGFAYYIARIFNINKPGYRNLRDKFLFRYHITPEEFEIIFNENFGEIPEAPDIPDLPKVKSLAKPILPEPPHELSEEPGPRYLLVKGRYKINRRRILSTAPIISSDKPRSQETIEFLLNEVHMTRDELALVHEAYYGPIPFHEDYAIPFEAPKSPDEIPSTHISPPVVNTYRPRVQQNISPVRAVPTPLNTQNVPNVPSIPSVPNILSTTNIPPTIPISDPNDIPPPTATRNVLIVPEEIPGVPKVYDDKTIFILNGKGLECRFLKNFVECLETNRPDFIEDCKVILADYNISKNEFLKLYYQLIKPFMKNG